MSGDQVDDFQYQMNRRALGVRIASETLSLRDELSNLGERALQNEEIERYLSQLNTALETVRFLDSIDFQQPDGYPIFMCSSNAFRCTVSLLAFENQLSGEDKNSLFECLHEFLFLTEVYCDYSLPEDGPEEETALELEDQLEGELSPEEGSKSTHYPEDESLEDDKAEIPGLSDVLGEDIHPALPGTSLSSLGNVETRLRGYRGAHETSQT